MKRLLFLIGALLCFCKVQSKAVFAHFMVGNVAFYTTQDWQIDIAAAAEVGIDAFALNIAYGDDTVSASVATAFTALSDMNTDFKLFFSFDYAGGGPWPSADVDSYLGEYTRNAGYYHTDGGQPFVSTFEGPANAQDWVALKANHNIFFMPDWSSLGAGPAWALGVADGLFSWAAWPWGSQDSNTWVDASYLQVLKDGGDTGPPYMMGVSPMFYTNLPGYDKNWAWRGDRLWFDRWKEVFFLQPDYVEIITWNDWGESHYIAPVDPTQSDSVLSLGQAPFDYVSAYSHDGWRYLLPVFTSLYKTGKAPLPSQIITAWGRSTSTNAACSVNGTTVNTASQLQLEFPPNQALSDTVFFVVFASDEVDPEVKVTVGGTSVVGGWSDYIEAGDATIYFGNASFVGLTGDVHITATNYGLDILTATGVISGDCSETDGYMNFNMWTTYEIEENIADQTAIMSIEDFVCIAGTSIEEFSELCEYTCALGYCPYTACLCSAIGPQPDRPTPVATQCYPLANASVVYEGLCSFACTYGYFDTDHCGTAEVAAPTPTVSPFNPDAAIGGTGNGDNPAFDDLCEFTCQYGYCPIAACIVTDVGDLVLFTGDVTTAKANFTAEPWNEFLNDLCTFSCNRGHCPDSCSSDLACTSGIGDGNYGGLCDFSCGYGFCPAPCTCLSNGTRSTPPTYDPNIVGYPDTGLDVDTYGPLCNFTCSHGYCPTPGACLEALSINPDLENTTFTLPALEDYVPENVTYTPGDLYVYISDENPDLSLQVTLQGANGASDVPAGSLDRDDLDEIGDAAELIMITILNDDYALSKRNVRAHNDYQFVTHSHWKPSGNCTTRHCMLAAGAPLETWTSVGNGSYKGVPHEVRFMNTGKNYGYSATRQLLSNSTHSKRRYGSISDTQFVFGQGYLRKPLISWDEEEFGNFDKPIEDLTAYGAMDSANKGYLTNCNVYMDNSTAFDDDNATSIAAGGMSFSVPGVATAAGLSAAAIDKLVSTCVEEEATPHTYVIYPRDGNDIDTLLALLTSFQNINLFTCTSVIGNGVLFWTADLTPQQWRKVTQEKQCYAAPAKCEGDSCIDPSADLVDIDGSATYNTTAWIIKNNDTAPSTGKLSERDGPIATQSNAPPDLWFISQPPGTDPLAVSGPGTYTYDSTGGANVVVYILDAGRFDMTFPEFSEWALVPGTNQIVSTITPKLFGKSDWVPSFDPDGTSHGTGMLAAMAGRTQGVAKAITPVPITFNYEDGAQWILPALDYIQGDWRIRRSNAAASGSALAPLAVLSMSFTYPKSPEWDAVGFLMALALPNLVAEGILPVAAVGNTGSIIDRFPARFADNTDELEFVESLVAVGSVGNTGYQSVFSSYASYVQLWAPGENIASPYWSGGVQSFLYKSGTSPATAKVAGLAAYLIGLSSKAALYTNTQAVVDDMVKMAWARQSLPAIYNGIVLTG